MLKGEEEKRVGHDFCGDPALLQDGSDCSKYVNFVELEKYYNENCKSKEKCDINLSSYMKKDPEGASEFCVGKYS